MTTTTVIPTWTLAEKLQKARKTAGISRADMAQRLGKAERTVISWECSEREPHITLVERWAHLTSVDFDWLSEGVVRPKGFEPLTF
ncbi:MAG: helix-turn-helix transcriptional regulator [Aeromicrobium sp.]|uniref:helix-turn-helix domain-containing protein n=1 Tax=Aeromicrobium sp. TaxID=1871063 RepID=UPI00262278FA|nr:helix-turn-helix transcriptional regulator [Aeromicrobium sp.]MDF1705054.1 helix-turn-helix transcriptional regulator [Aeromicrobium sp.]